MKPKKAMRASINDSAVLREENVTITLTFEVGHEFSGYVTRYHYQDDPDVITHHDKTWEGWVKHHIISAESDEWEPE